MEKRGNGRAKAMRERIAQEAARIMAQEGLRDFALAKRKAALHLGAVDTRHMPSNVEIEQALMEYQRLFHADEQRAALRKRLEVAVRAMELFAAFQPRLVGEVLSGTANRYSDVSLHLFSDPAEALALFLMERHIPYEQVEKRLRVGRDQWQNFSAYRFVADDIGVELIVFPLDGMRQAPLSPVNGKPMRRASLEAVRRLLDQDC